MGKSRSKKLLSAGLLIFTLMTGMTIDSTAKNKSLPEEQTMSEAQKLLAEADAAFNSYRHDESRSIYEKALKAAETAGNNSDITEAVAMIARTYLTTGDKAKADEWLGKAEKTVDINEERGWSRYQAVMGRLLWKEMKLIEATNLFEELFDYCWKRQLHDRAIDAARMAAITGIPEQQIAWGKKGIEVAETTGAPNLLGPLWNNLGAAHEDQKDYDQALEAYLKAREYHWQYGNEINKMVADWAVGHTHRLSGKHGKAVEWLRPVLAWCERIEENEFIGLTCRELGEIDFAAEKHESALEYFIRAEKLLKEAGMDNWDPDGYRKIEQRISQLREKNK